VLDWRTQTYAQLSRDELFEILKLRQTIFVVEQACAYADIDNVDKIALHLSATDNSRLAAYARIIKPGVTYEYASIGRVVIAASHRGTGLGNELMQKAISVTKHEYPQQPIKIGAQHHLEKFYIALGFTTVSEPYDDEGIMHIDMLRK